MSIGQHMRGVLYKKRSPNDPGGARRRSPPLLRNYVEKQRFCCTRMMAGRAFGEPARTHRVRTFRTCQSDPSNCISRSVTLAKNAETAAGKWGHAYFFANGRGDLHDPMAKK
jgi:hypothetical protein